MNNVNEILVLSATRTAVGTFGGALKNVPLSDLATTATKAAIGRSGVDPAAVGNVVMGNVIQTEPRDAYLSRVAAIQAGVPKETPAYNVNRLCGSGLQAVISAAQSIQLGDCEVAIGAGAESMSRAPFLSTSSRWGARLGDATLTDGLLGALHDPFHAIHMGITAENVAQKYGITRHMMDELAVESHNRAASAIAQGLFRDQIVGIEVGGRKGSVTFDTDEHVKPEARLEELSMLKPAFKKEGGTVTAGNASGLNDGASAVVLASGDFATRQGLRPIARLVAYAHAGVDPEFMGIGPVPASRLALERAGLRIEDPKKRNLWQKNSLCTRQK